MLDSCSQAYFLINDTCKHLALTTQRVDVPLCDTNQMTSHINQITRAKVLSRISVNTAELTFLVVDKVSQLVPSEDIDQGKLDLSENTPLADP